MFGFQIGLYELIILCCYFCQAEENGFADFHLYVCAAFLVRFTQDILREHDFQVKIMDNIDLEKLILRSSQYRLTTNFLQER